jgi:hypothetical protein
LAVIAYGKTASFTQRKWWGLEKIPISELDKPLSYIEEQAAKDCWIVLRDFGSNEQNQQFFCLKQLRK